MSESSDHRRRQFRDVGGEGAECRVADVAVAMTALLNGIAKDFRSYVLYALKLRGARTAPHEFDVALIARNRGLSRGGQAMLAAHGRLMPLSSYDRYYRREVKRQQERTRYPNVIAVRECVPI